LPPPRNSSGRARNSCDDLRAGSLASLALRTSPVSHDAREPRPGPGAVVRRGGVCVTAAARGRTVGPPPLLGRPPLAWLRGHLQLHHVISDITGQTGLAIVDRILAGERDPWVLAKLRNERIKANQRSHRQIAGGRLSSRAPVHFATVPGSLSQLSEAHRRLRSRDSPILGGVPAASPARRPERRGSPNPTQPTVG